MIYNIYTKYVKNHIFIYKKIEKIHYLNNK